MTTQKKIKIFKNKSVFGQIVVTFTQKKSETQKNTYKMKPISLADSYLKMRNLSSHQETVNVTSQSPPPLRHNPSRMKI